MRPPSPPPPPPPPPPMAHARRGATTSGFTLLELLVGVALTAGLAMLALPGFQRHLLQAHRTEALRQLMAAQQAQATYRSRHPRYAATLAELGLGEAGPQDRYRLRVDQASATRYALEALAQGDQAADRLCQRLRLTLDGGIARHQAFDVDGQPSTERCWPQ